MSKVYIEPNFRGVDEGEGGIRRIVDKMKQHLPTLGYEITTKIDEADLVHTHAGMTPDVPLEIPWIASCHGLYWQEYNWSRWHHDLNRQVIDAMRRADHVTAPSEWVAQTLRRGMWLRPTVLHHGVDMEEWEPASDALKYVLWNKNREDPICDAEPVRVLSGRAPDLDFITTIGAEAPNVRVCGRQDYPAMRDLIRHAGVYLCTTRETFGIGTLEAMAAGVPVVGWAWGGQREIIEHGLTGWLCPPGDYGGLIEGLKWALNNRKRIGGRAREAVETRWTWAHRMVDYATLYHRLIEEKQAQQGGPAVSVIVPCYNLARYLPDTIASLQAQTFQNWEAIIVDDASPDDTHQVAAALAAEDPRIRVLTNPTNLYLAGTLNAGIAIATGRNIMPLDADNMIEPNTLEVLSAALARDRGIDIAYGGCRFVLEDGVTRDASVSPDGVSNWPGEFSYRGQITHHNQIPSTALYRREVWERSGGYRGRCPTAEDAEFWTRVTSLGFVPKRVTRGSTLIYRQREDSMSRVVPEWDWAAWSPWSRHMALTPFGVEERPPERLNGGLSWNVPSYEPIKVTVIIPVGPGHEALLIDALDSVEAQTFRDWECIVVNDTGGHLTIPHPWVHVLNTPGRKSVGPGAARNLGIAAAKGALILPLDADDYLQPDAIELLRETWQQVGGVVYSQWYDDKGEEGTTVYEPPEYDARLLTTRGTIHAVTALYPRSALDEVGGFDPHLTHWEDWDLQLKLAAKGICGTLLPRPLFTYRKNKGMRREANMAAFEDGKAAIMQNWSRLWDGKETLMACGSCPGGGGGRSAPPPLVQQGVAGVQALLPQEGYVVLRYNGVSPSTRTYRGKSTGASYRFGNSPHHKEKYVYRDDSAELLALMEGSTPLFEISRPVVASEAPREPQLVAAGSPQQPMEDMATTMPPAPVALQEAVAGLGPQLAQMGSSQMNTSPPPPADPPSASAPLKDYTSKEIRALAGRWPPEEVRRYLAHEGAKAQPRGTVMNFLTTHLRRFDT